MLLNFRGVHLLTFRQLANIDLMSFFIEQVTGSRRVNFL